MLGDNVEKKNAGKNVKGFWEIGYLSQIMTIYIIVTECKSISSKFKNNSSSSGARQQISLMICKGKFLRAEEMKIQKKEEQK